MTIEEKIKAITESEDIGDIPLAALPTVRNERFYFVSYSHKDYKEVYRDLLMLEEISFKSCKMLRVIENGAFADCPFLRRIELPDSITDISLHALPFISPLEIIYNGSPDKFRRLTIATELDDYPDITVRFV